MTSKQKREPTCRIHGSEMICPKCIGAIGGRSRSAKKRAAVIENAKKGSDARRAGRALRAAQGS